jgi:hypothetical protein
VIVFPYLLIFLGEALDLVLDDLLSLPSRAELALLLVKDLTVLSSWDILFIDSVMSPCFTEEP